MSSTSTDYKPELVRERIVDVFKKRKGEATTADLVALTGLPKAQVEAEVPAVSDEYGARLRVTESGEILWSFPSGMHSRYRGLLPSLKRGWKAFKKGFVAAASFLFKAWIVVMLVGYFALFVALVVLALVASIAVSMSGSKDDRGGRRGGGGLGGLYLTTRLIDTFVRIWFYSELFKSPEDRYNQRSARYERKKEKRPLHKAIFSFVLGDGDPNADWDTVEKKAVVAFLQANKGIITIHEFMAITGLPPLEAETRINRYLFEFEGEPLVSDAGTIYYSFPGLLRRKDRVDRTYGGTTPMKRLAPFSSNPAKMNRWFAFLNGFNLLFGGYFLSQALAAHPVLEALYAGKYALKLVMVRGFDAFYLFTHQLLGKFAGVADPAPVLGWALGAVPLVFSALFYLIPFLRKLRVDAANERIKKENLRRVAYRAVLDSPSAARPEAIGLQVASSAAANPKDKGVADKVLVELAAATGGEPAAGGAYAYPAIAESQEEARKARAAVRDSDFDLGQTVFDSHS
jgi:hypothetical protein